MCQHVCVCEHACVPAGLCIKSDAEERRGSVVVLQRNKRAT